MEFSSGVLDASPAPAGNHWHKLAIDSRIRSSVSVKKNSVAARDGLTPLLSTMRIASSRSRRRRRRIRFANRSQALIPSSVADG